MGFGDIESLSTVVSLFVYLICWQCLTAGQACTNSTEPPRVPVIKVIPACYRHRVTGLISTCYLSLAELHEAAELCGPGTLQRRSWRRGNKAQTGCTSTREVALLSGAVLLPGPSLLPAHHRLQMFRLTFSPITARRCSVTSRNLKVHLLSPTNSMRIELMVLR